MKFSYSLLKKILPRIPAQKKVAEMLPLHVFEVEGIEGDALDVKVLPNRYADAAGHVGLAREIAAIFHLPFSYERLSVVNPRQDLGILNVVVKNKKICTHYGAFLFEFENGESTPAWMQKILVSCGINPINLAVDLANYVMLETGQPLHVFDADKIFGGRNGSKQLTVRPALQDEKIVTLDGREFVLDPRILVIADPQKVLAIAGIKGGAEAAVTEKTRRVIVEAARFDSAHILASSRILKLSTDASVRFAHGTASANAQWALAVFAHYLANFGATLTDSVLLGSTGDSSHIISFSSHEFVRKIGMEVSIRQAQDTLRALGCEIIIDRKNKDPHLFLVRPPIDRLDLETPIDLYEEVIRLIGVNTLVGVSPRVSLAAPVVDDVVVAQDRLKTLLVKFGLSEVYNSSFVGVDEQEAIRGAHDHLFSHYQQPIEIENPISRDKNYFRSSLASQLKNNVIDNSRFYDFVKIFEIGHVAAVVDGVCDETVSVAGAFWGKQQNDFVREATGVVEEILESFGIASYEIRQHSVSGDATILIEGTTVGRMCSFDMRKELSGGSSEVVTFEMNVAALVRFIQDTRVFRPLPKFPSIIRDVSFLCSQEFRVGEIVEEVYGAGGDLLVDVDLIDEYEDNVKFSGFVSVTLRLVFQSTERNLTDVEVNDFLNTIIQTLEKKFRVRVR